MNAQKFLSLCAAALLVSGCGAAGHPHREHSAPGGERAASRERSEEQAFIRCRERHPITAQAVRRAGNGPLAVEARQRACDYLLPRGKTRAWSAVFAREYEEDQHLVHEGGCSLNATRPDGPVSVSANRPVEGLQDVQFVSASTGWVVASDALLVTTDAGRRWTVQTHLRTLGWRSLDFINPSDGWVVGVTGLLHTTDSGKHWYPLSQTCPAIRILDFVSPEDGFAIASGEGPGSLPALWGSRGTVLLRSDDGGRSWQRLATPSYPQSVCFHDSQRGWLGAGGKIYETTDGGRHWRLSFKGLAHEKPGDAGTIALECAGARSGWGELIGPGAGSSQTPHIGLHSSGGPWTAIFAEQYFPHPGISASQAAPGSSPAAFSAINAADAAFIDWCSACQPDVNRPIAIATDGGARLKKTGYVSIITDTNGASFVSTRQGWVVGAFTLYRKGRRTATTQRIVHTGDGGRTWRVQYSTQPVRVFAGRASVPIAR